MKIAWAITGLILCGLCAGHEGAIVVAANTPKVVKLFEGEVKPATIKELTPVPAPASPVIPNAPLVLSVDRFRWFTLASYTGPVTWQCDTDGIIKVLETAKPATLIGRFEGAEEANTFDVPAGAAVVTPLGKKSGTAKLEAWGVVDGRAKRLDSILLLVGSSPPPGPTPPTPVPPTPTVKPAWLTIIHDKQNTTPALAAFLNDGAAWKEVSDAGVKYDKLDESQAETKNRFGLLLPQLKLPAVVTQKASGEVIYAGPMTFDRATLKKVATEGKP